MEEVRKEYYGASGIYGSEFDATEFLSMDGGASGAVAVLLQPGAGFAAEFCLEAGRSSVFPKHSCLGRSEHHGFQAESRLVPNEKTGIIPEA